MLHYNDIDISEDIDVNKKSSCKEFIIFYYWHFLDKGFKFQYHLSVMVVMMY